MSDANFHHSDEIDTNRGVNPIHSSIMMGNRVEDDKESIFQNKKAMKAPNRKKFEDQIKELSQIIKEKEAELKQLSNKMDDRLPVDLKNLRTEKASVLEKRKQNDVELRMLSSEVRKKTDELSKVQSRLHYKSEDKINEAIRRLKVQLSNKNFVLREEKRIVSEIDSLTRSKKSLSQYLVQKEEVDAMRIQQNEFRAKRDSLFQFVTFIQKKEEEIRRKIVTDRKISEDLKKAIDDLYGEKRTLVMSFKRDEKEFTELKRETVIKQQQERKAQAEAKKEAKIKEIEEFESLCVPYEQELHLCATLIAYLQKHNDKISHTAISQAASLTTSSTPPDGEEGLYVLHRKSEEESYCAISKSKKLNKKNKKRNCHVKPLSHATQTLAQFMRLGVSPPSSTTDIPAVLEQLLELKSTYTTQQQLNGNNSDNQSIAESCDSNISTTSSLSRSISCDSSCNITVTDDERDQLEFDGKSSCDSEASIETTKGDFDLTPRPGDSNDNQNNVDNGNETTCAGTREVNCNIINSNQNGDLIKPSIDMGLLGPINFTKQSNEELDQMQKIFKDLHSSSR